MIDFLRTIEDEVAEGGRSVNDISFERPEKTRIMIDYAISSGGDQGQKVGDLD